MDVTYSTTGADWKYPTTTGGDSKTGAATNIGVCGFGGKKRTDLDNHHNLGLYHMADRCSVQILSGLAALNSRDFSQRIVFDVHRGRRAETHHDDGRRFDHLLKTL